LKREFNIETYEEMVRLAKMSCYQKTFDVNDSRYLSPKSMYREIEMELRKRYDKSPENKGDIINSVFHSLAKCYSVAVEEIETITGKKYDSIIIFGGGAKNNYLNSLVENYTKKTVNAYPIEASALGNIKIQSEVIK
jgi:rhamnulokinase